MAYMPPGWPEGAHPPRTERFEETAVAWLYDVMPPEYRQHDVPRRRPVALAYMARHHCAANAEGARQAYRTVRGELAERVPPHAADQALTVLRVTRGVGWRLSRDPSISWNARSAGSS